MAAAAGAGAARADRARLPLVVGPGRGGALPRARPARMGAPCPEPGSTARRPDAPPGGDGRLARPDPRADRPAAARARGRPRAPRDADRRARRPGRLRLRGVRRAPVAAHLLRRARRARRRHPQGRERPRAAGDRGRAALPQGVLPAARRPDGAAARVLDADHARAASDGSGARRRRRPAHALVPLLRPRGRVPRLAGGDRARAALPPRRRARGERPARPVDHRPALRGEPAHAPRPVRAARPRDGARPSGTRDRARGAALQRGPSRPRRARAGGRGGGDGRGDRRCARSGARALRVHDAHPRPGRERDLRDDVVPRGVRRPAAAPGHRSGQVPRPLPHPSGKRRVAGHDAARAAVSRAARTR